MRRRKMKKPDMPEQKRRFVLKETGKKPRYFGSSDAALIARGRLPLERWAKSYVLDTKTNKVIGGAMHPSLVGA